MMWMLYMALTVAAFLFMEGVAWATHKYVMHGFLWSWHKSHHYPYQGVFEKNDLFGIVFSIPSIVCCVAGLHYPDMLWLFFIGLGIFLYGVFYVIFHDIIVHRRIKMKFRARSAYMKRLIRAHKIHHKHQGKENGEAFGFLFARAKYAQKESEE